MSLLRGSLLLISLLLTAICLAMTPAEYLKAQPTPVFREGHTLLPLSRFGWTLPFDARVELAERWGYCLEFGGYATNESVAALEKPDSVESKLVALTAADPKRYPLCVITARDFPKELPPDTWACDADGKLIDGKQVWSPEAPDSVFQQAGELRAAPLRKIREKAPIAIILNGGEYAMSVLGADQKSWEKDPRIVKAKGERTWYDYISERKAHQEMIISDAVRHAAPDRRLYVYYTTSANPQRNSYGGWYQWCWSYEMMQPVSDLPSEESYYQSFNSGFTGNTNMLTQMLNVRGVEISRGQPLSYNWLCAGWPRGKDGDLADIPTYMGYLKCYYTAGMIGGNAGYYDYPKGGFGVEFAADAPPHWLRQMVALSQVHALFTHLERYLRQGDLLPGPNRHKWSKDIPAYEFPTGDDNARVLARKIYMKPDWLITAWAADGKDREVTVTIPELGEVKLQARACGSVYTSTRANGAAEVKLIDVDGTYPTKGMAAIE